MELAPKKSMMADRLLTSPFLFQALLSMKQTFVNRHGDGV
jgi:hypothetical protein